MSFGFGFSLPAILRKVAGYDPFNQSGPTLDLVFAGVATDLDSLGGYTLTTDFIVPQYQIAAQYTVWENGMGLVSKSFSDIITFSRASTATYFDSAGVLQSAANDVPRFDYNPSTLAAQGLLIEEQRTNLCLASEDFFQTGTGGVNWIWPAGVVTGDTQVAPDGTTTADTITTIGGAQSIYQSITVTASTTYTFSMFVKLGTMSAANYKLAFYDNTAATFIATDVVPSQTPTTTSWTRVTYTFTTPVGCTSVRVYPFRNSATITSSTVFIWGAQLEAGAFPTSYIPTTVAQATRQADAASVNTLSPWYNAAEGTIYTEFSAYNTSASRALAQLDDTGFNNRIFAFIQSNNGMQTNVVVGGSSVAQLFPAGTYASPAIGKVSQSYAVNNFASCFDGGAVSTDTSGAIPTVTQMRIGFDGGSAYANGHLRRITYYPRRLSNAELQAITS